MKAGELREIGADELRAREKDLDDRLLRMRIQKAMGHLEKPGMLATLRRDVARIKTVLREKQEASK